MRIDTEILNELADRIDQLRTSAQLSSPQLTQRHAEMMQILAGMSGFFRSVSQLAEETENSVFREAPFTVGGPEGLTLSGSVSGRPERLLKGASIKASGKAHYSLSTVEGIIQDDSGFLTGAFSIGEGMMAGTAAFRLMSKGQFDPSLKISGEVSGNLFNASARAETNRGVAGGFVEAAAEVGAVYGSFESAFSSQGVDLEAKVGAAAVRGECAFGFKLFDFEISISAEGSLWSAEAGFEYHHSAREWEIGSKLGFIAGLGVKINVKY